MDNGTILAINGVIYVPNFKLTLVSVDSITKSTHFEALFGKKNDYLLTDSLNLEFRRVFGHNYGGLYYLATRVLFGIGLETTDSTRKSFSTLANTITTTLCKQARHFKSGIVFANVTFGSKPNLCKDYTLFDAHYVLGHPSFKALDLMVKR